MFSNVFLCDAALGRNRFTGARTSFSYCRRKTAEQKIGKGQTATNIFINIFHGTLFSVNCVQY